MRLLLVVNSFASSVTARNKVLIEEILMDGGHEVTLKETNRRGHATRFAQDAASREWDVVVALGGDGTLNEVANGLAGSTTALGVLPGGSTNVFARTIGMENDPVAAARQLAAGLAAETIRPIGLGNVNGRYFCFHTGVGFDAAVVANVEKRSSIKRWLGHPLFIYAGLKTFFRTYDRKHPHFTVNTVGQTYPASFTVVLNTNPYTYLGNRPLDLAPAASLESALSTVTFTRMPVLGVLTALGRTLLGGGVRGKAVITEDGLSALTIESATPFPYQLDGDYLGETLRLAFRWEPDAIRLVLPG
jgi:YegS/Rv2252/BmrU family lipid kinase